MSGSPKVMYLGLTEDHQVIERPYHAVGVYAGEYTLCGLGNLDDPEAIDDPEPDKKHKVDCPDCIATIEHCKGFRKGRDY